MTTSIDPTNTPAWKRLEEHAGRFTPNLRTWFATDPGRASNNIHQPGDLWVDLSKNLFTPKTITLLLDLADETRVLQRRDAMFAGAHINTTEDRAVLHTALRRPSPEGGLIVDGQNIDADVHAVLERMYEFARAVRSGQWTGASGKAVRTVVNIGIGGSDLGPAMVYDALRPYAKEGLQARFWSNIDPTDAAETLAGLDPETTLFIVASKTFGTLETLTNARLAREWLWRGLERAGVIGDDDEARAGAVAKHFVAVSTALDRVADFGIDPDNAFGFWDWVGGRYSVGSAVGLSLAITLGPEHFAAFLAGFARIDDHFRTAHPAQNAPLLMGLLNVWYVNFLGAPTHAILPYSQYLHRFPAYLQQLTMESNGKGVRFTGELVTYRTGEVFWGEPGTNGQHAFYQLIHQGTQLVPADFIAVARPAHDLRDGDQDVHDLFMANFFAQTRALAFGKTPDEVRAEGTPEGLVSARTFPGNRPTTSIIVPELSPSVMGQLIALYEHITFVQGAVWGINSFDQWGVELGKELATEIAPALAGDGDALASQDPATRAAIDHYLALRRGQARGR